MAKGLDRRRANEPKTLEPMTLMHKRQREIDSTQPATILAMGKWSYHKPQHSKGVLEATAHAVASWEISDPFAYGRTYLHTKQGYIDPLQTIADMSSRVAARRAARAKLVAHDGV